MFDGEGRVLLLRRALDPARGRLGLPGGFVDIGETVDGAVRRETREETGLEIESIAFLGGWPNVYEWHGIGYPVLDLYFTARARGGLVAVPRHEVDSYLWARPGEIDPESLAFPTTRLAHARLLERPLPGGGPGGGERALHVVLVEPEIHWNTGNAGRSCLAAGAQLHLVEPLGFSLDEREVRRAGLDYWERVRPRVWTSWDALGLMQQLPESDKHNYSREYWRDRICIAFGGRAAEELIFGEITTGASSDISVATHMARKMVCEWGMSDKLGPLAYGRKEEAVFLGREIGHQRDYSENTSNLIDEEIRTIVDTELERARKILADERPMLEALARALLKDETLDSDQIDRILRGEGGPDSGPKSDSGPADQSDNTQAAA